jgi:hypothetical protein
VATLTAGATARAFHAGNTFDAPPGAGGGGGVFYTGSSRERGWTCAACHTGAPGSIRVDLDANPRSLFDTFAYVPGQAYAITATMVGEHAGLDAPNSNYNSIAVSVVDASGNPAGSISGYAAEDFYPSGPATIVSAGKTTGVTMWSFTWRAPAGGAGPVKVHIASVDGNGANSGATEALTDPWDDDVFVGALALDGPPPSEVTASQQNVGFAAVAALAAMWLTRRLRRRRSEVKR